MIGQLDLDVLQSIWWLICSLVGALFIFMSFVQGGQTLLLTAPKDEEARNLMVNSLGRKWEVGFTTLVLFGGALFAAFPLFYASSFGGAYWVWILILLTFVFQAVSYEFRRKPGNFLGPRLHELFLFVNGSVGLLLIGTAIGSFFTGSDFLLNDYNLVTWQHPLRGLEAALNLFNLSLGMFLVFHARTLGSLYLVNNLVHHELENHLRRASLVNLLCSLPFLLYVLVSLLFMTGFAVDPVTGTVSLVSGKYLHNLLAMPLHGIAFLLIGLALVLCGVFIARFTVRRSGIWAAGPGTVLVVLALLFTAGYNDTAFYPSRFDLQSSLTIHNASSSHFTLTTMSYIALAVPFVLAYIAYVWRVMDTGKMSENDISADKGHDFY